MIVHISIPFDPDLLRRARLHVGRLGISFPEYVRRLVAEDLRKNDAPRADPRAVFDLGSSGGSDVAAAKDELLGWVLDLSRRT